jgi:hypothetical protein
VVARDDCIEFPTPDGLSREFLAAFGDFHVILVNSNLETSSTTTHTLFPFSRSKHKEGHQVGASIGIPAFRDTVITNPAEWTVEQASSPGTNVPLKRPCAGQAMACRHWTDRHPTYFPCTEREWLNTIECTRMFTRSAASRMVSCEDR